MGGAGRRDTPFVSNTLKGKLQRLASEYRDTQPPAPLNAPASDDLLDPARTDRIR